jgi:hypothetical protein
MNRSDFYATSAQVLPLMTLAIVLEVRRYVVGQTQSGSGHGGWLPALGVIFVLGLMMCGEAAALTGLMEGDERELRDAVATALYGGAVVLCLALIEVVVSPVVADRHRAALEVARNVTVVCAVAAWFIFVA